MKQTGGNDVTEEGPLSPFFFLIWERDQLSPPGVLHEISNMKCASVCHDTKLGMDVASWVAKKKSSAHPVFSTRFLIVVSCSNYSNSIMSSLLKKPKNKWRWKFQKTGSTEKNIAGARVIYGAPFWLRAFRGVGSPCFVTLFTSPSHWGATGLWTKDHPSGRAVPIGRPPFSPIAGERHFFL